MMGLEEHLLQMFREDFEFHPNAAPSHLGPGSVAAAADRVTPLQNPPASPLASAQPDRLPPAPAAPPEAERAPNPSITAPTVTDPGWAAEAESELRKIPFFVRGKARRNTERFARDRGLALITLETLYDAKAHFSA